jgi:hypothetical protein
MIFDTLISLGITGLQFIIGLFPAADPNVVAFINNGVTSFRAALISVNWFFPVDTLLQVLGYMFIIEAAMLLIKLIRYIAGVLTVGVLK